MIEKVDVVVIGAGPAGSAAAGVLRRAGVDVVVLEKQHFPRPVIGESLLPRAMAALEEAGLLSAVLTRGYQRKDGAVFVRGDEVTCFNFDEQHAPGWDHALQVPRADFDEVLANACSAMGADVRFGVEVVGITQLPAHEDAAMALEARDESGLPRSLRCRFLIDASGYGRVASRLLQLDAPSTQPDRKSLFSWVKSNSPNMTKTITAETVAAETVAAETVAQEAAAQATDEPPPEGAVWVYLRPGGAWIWVIPFSDGHTSVGVVAPPAFYDAWPSDPTAALRALLAADPHLSARFPEPSFAFEPRTIQAYSSESSQLFGRGYCLVGNALGFLDPVFSSGVTVALVSAVQAAKLVCQQLDGQEVNWQADYADPMTAGVGVFRTYVNAWYDGSLPRLFFRDAPSPTIKRQVCSVLAGYVWDASNPFVAQASRKLAQVRRLMDGAV